MKFTPQIIGRNTISFINGEWVVETPKGDLFFPAGPNGEAEAWKAVRAVEA